LKSFCDLHIHSNCSDGTLPPAQLIREAEKRGLGAIALTDHNTIAGLPEFLAAAEGSTVRAVPGIEFSAEYLDTELHILALFVTPGHYDAINARKILLIRAYTLMDAVAATLFIRQLLHWNRPRFPG